MSEREKNCEESVNRFLIFFSGEINSGKKMDHSEVANRLRAMIFTYGADMLDKNLNEYSRSQTPLIRSVRDLISEYRKATLAYPAIKREG